MDNVISVSLTQIAGQAASLVVYLIGIFLAIVFWKRYPVPSLCVFIGSLVLLVTMFGQILVSNYLLIHVRDAQGWTHEEIARALSFSAIVGSSIRAAAFGLVLAAVFIGRRPAPLQSHTVE
jgi:hypothetical protein